MAYVPNEWQDRIGTGLNNFTDQNGNELTLTPNPTSITQAGTPFSAEWMNHIEQGISTLDQFFSSVDPVIKKAARAQLGMGKLLWSGNWSMTSGAPASIPGISQYSLILVQNQIAPIICGIEPVTGNFVGKGPSRFISASSQSLVEYFAKISVEAQDHVSGLVIGYLTYFGAPNNTVSVTIDNTNEITQIYGLL